MSREERGRYFASREWALLRERVRDRSKNTCERCQRRPMDAVHHVTYERFMHERLDDLMAICDPCHEYLSGKRDYDPVIPEEFQSQAKMERFLGDLEYIVLNAKAVAVAKAAGLLSLAPDSFNLDDCIRKVIALIDCNEHILRNSIKQCKDHERRLREIEEIKRYAAQHPEIRDKAAAAAQALIALRRQAPYGPTLKPAEITDTPDADKDMDVVRCVPHIDVLRCVPRRKKR